MNSKRFNDYSQENSFFTSRAIIAFILVVAMMGILIGRIYYLQVIEHDRLAAISERNRIQLQPVAPRRGLIYDRNGILLADNRPNFTLTLLKEEVGDLDKTLERLGQLLDITEDDIQRFKRRLDQRRRPFETVPLKFRLTEQEIAKISVSYYRLPGVQVEADLVRSYPYGGELAHALGYVGRINERELQRVNANNYAATHYIGKLGVERYYEPLLHGEVGLRKVETDARGRVLRIIEQQDPIPGVDIQLSLDLKLQQFTAGLVKNKRAAVVAMDPKSGEILALVSNPYYDPNEFVTGISYDSYNALRENPDLPLYNRAIRGLYPPGSTLKPFTAIAALDSGSVPIDHEVWDPGYFQLTKNGRRYRDWKRGGHGHVDLNHALAESCDVWFYDVASRTDIDVFSDYLGRFGFGSVTSLDMSEANAAILPSRQWKRERDNLPWYPGDSLNLSIGQGFMITTPLQLATATSVLANKGHWVRPQLLKRVIAEQGLTKDQQQLLSELEAKPRPANITLNHPEYWDKVIQGMVDVVNAKYGTARRAGAGAAYIMAGKTGTAQVVGIKQDAEYDSEALLERHRDHALFIAFAPAEDPQIVVSVIVENGEGGSRAAAPVAREVIDAWLTGDYEDSLGDD